MACITIENAIEYFLMSLCLFLAIYGFFGGILFMADIRYNIANGVGLFLAMILTSIFMIIAMCVRMFEFNDQRTQQNGV